MLTAVLLLAFLAPPQLVVPFSDCQTSDQCGEAQCMVWEHGRFVCEAKQYGVAVWDRDCLEKIEFGKESTMEAPLDTDGKPNMSEARTMKTIVTKKAGCEYHLEVRSR